MKVTWLAVLGAGILGGCAGVPSVYGDAAGHLPPVQEIARHLSCELHADTSDMTQLARWKYFITILLTLQVDDNVDFTPSIGFINPLSGTSENVTTSVSGDLGGARRRTFTSTYTLNADLLQKHGDEWCMDYRKEKKAYRLDGDLGLAGVVKDGLDLIAPQRPAIHQPSMSGDKAAPSFGSTIQFTITKSLTGIGPVWTVKRFKGPGGSNGLLNAKRLDTDSIVITFAPQPDTSGEKKLQTEAGARLTAATMAVDDSAQSAAEIEALAAAAHQHALAARKRAARRLTSSARRTLLQDAEKAEANAREVDIRLRTARTINASARASLSAAQVAVGLADQAAAQAEVQASTSAISATQSLQTIMVLQNLIGPLPAR